MPNKNGNNGNHFGQLKNSKKTSNSEESKKMSNSEESKNTSELEDLKKELYYFSKEFVQKNFEIFQSSIQALQNSLSTLQSVQSSTSSQLGDISNKMTNLLDVVIPELESEIAQSSGGGKKWITMYDKDSPDPELNKGVTTGLKYVNFQETVGTFDITPYSQMRVLFVPGSTNKKYYEYDLETARGINGYNYTLLFPVRTGESIAISTIYQVVRDDGTTCLRMYHVDRLEFRNKSTVTYKIVDDEDYHYAKIEFC